MNYQQHIFVCTNTRPDGASCGAVGSQIVLALREKVKQRGQIRQICITKSGCLGQCLKGPVAVNYPEAKWYFNIQSDQEILA